MKPILIACVLCASVFAQDSGGTVTKLAELNNVKAQTVGDLVRAFNVKVDIGPDPGFLTIRGAKESVEAAEQALKRLDRPKKSIEATFQILSATKAPNNEKLPAELANVVKQLRGALTYQGFRLVETLQVRTREGSGVREASSAMRVDDENAPSGTFQVRFTNTTVSSEEKQPMVRFDGLRFGARLPVGVKTSTGTTTYNFVETGVNTDIDVREGQTVVVGRANLDGKEGTFFLVVNAKVLD